MPESNASPILDDDDHSSPILNHDAGANTGSHITEQPNNKKRKAGTSSRGVANLTPEQLAKKRANDRDAQRAIRERTKSTIESLEKKIQQLESQAPYQELQHILRQKELVELENAEIKRRLAAVQELLQPILTGNLLAEAQRSSVEAVLDHSPVNSYAGQGLSNGTVAAPDLGIAGSTSTTSSPASWHLPLPQSLNHDKQRSATSRLGLRTTSEERPDSGVPGRAMHGNQHRMDTVMHTPLPADHHIILTPPTQQSPRMNRESRPQWEILPPWLSASSVFDGLLLDFTLEAQSRRAHGVSDFDLLGPVYPNFRAITCPSHEIPCHPISRFLRDILTPFPDVTIIANKVAIAYMMFLILRWHIAPTQENYDRLPSWIRPNSWQITIAHAIWIDHVPWPDMRTEMVREPHRYPFDRFFVPHTKTESLNWDHGEAAMYSHDVNGDAADGDQVLSPQYEAHIRTLDNWTLGPAFAQEFPGLASACRITSRGEEERRLLAEQIKAGKR